MRMMVAIVISLDCTSIGIVVKLIAISSDRVLMDVDGGFDGGFNGGFDGRFDSGFYGRFDGGFNGRLDLAVLGY
jgi:hypothetical protein